MGKLTRVQIRDYIRSITGEMDAERINVATLNEDINLSQRRIQLDFVGEGFKQFTKVSFLNGYISRTPDDMIFHPNAIIDLEASAGNRSSATYSFEDTNLTVEYLEPNTAGNGWVITFQNNSGATIPNVGSFSLTSKTMTINLNSGVTQVSAVRELFETDFMLSKLFNTSSTDEVEDFVIDGSSANITLSGGTTTGWKPAEERTIERFNRIKNVTFQAGTADEPVYKRVGDTFANQTIEFSPATIKYSKIYYHYIIPDLTSDSDVSGLPVELEGLLLTEVQRRVYIYLKQQSSSDAENIQYQKEVADLEVKYKKGLQIAMGEDIRLESADLT
ncbi:MAG TPA: hypothetical protein PL089_15000 [Ignavibacteria bacterium]|nr:hypothetical protein [Ignavibacteria bacterium]